MVYNFVMLLNLYLCWRFFYVYLNTFRIVLTHAHLISFLITDLHKLVVHKLENKAFLFDIYFWKRLEYYI